MLSDARRNKREDIAVRALPKDVEEISEDKMRRIAKIVGFQSAAEAAIQDFEARRAAGQRPVFLVSRSRHMFFVGDEIEERRLVRVGP